MKMSMFKSKISLRVLPDKQYYCLKSFYNTLVMFNVMDMQPLFKLIKIAQEADDHDTEVSLLG